ncbi:MAG: LrgB family protein [Spirochaetes bacterium]|nr:LrgB family protein [Spirochaetota bacterium]
MDNLLFLTSTIFMYVLAQTFQSLLMKKLGKVAFLFHPVLVSVIGLILVLVFTHTSYEVYAEGTEGLTFLLAPSVVALGVPLYKEWKKLAAKIGKILITVSFGSLVGILSSILPPLLWGCPPEVIFSLAPRSVTTPIAMNIAQGTGGVPSLTAAVVVATGIFGAVMGPLVLSLLGRIESSVLGIAIGVASHGIGTARALELGEREGAYSALGLCLNGVLTSILVPILYTGANFHWN